MGRKGAERHAYIKERGEVARIRVTELEYLTWFVTHADFGPAHGDVVDGLNQKFMDETGANIPEGWNFAQDGETSIDRD